MKTYRIPFKKTVWGFSEVKAKNKKEAIAKLGDCDDEFDKNSDYEYDFDEIEAIKWKAKYNQ